MTTNAAPNPSRVLIIDDNPTIHEDIRKILSPPLPDAEMLDMAAELFGEPESTVEQQIFRIDSALQGQEGLTLVERALADKDPYALAFVDVRMPPGWDGIETIRQIWKLYPELQVVVCTAYSDRSWGDIVNTVGHSDGLLILKKPFDNVEVLQLAHALTRKWNLSREVRENQAQGAAERQAAHDLADRKIQELNRLFTAISARATRELARQLDPGTAESFGQIRTDAELGVKATSVALW